MRVTARGVLQSGQPAFDMSIYWSALVILLSPKLNDVKSKINIIDCWFGGAPLYQILAGEHQR